MKFTLSFLIFIITLSSFLAPQKSLAVTTCEIAIRKQKADSFFKRIAFYFDPRNYRDKLPSQINWQEVDRLIHKYRLGTQDTEIWLNDVATRASKGAASYEEVMASGAVISPARTITEHGRFGEKIPGSYGLALEQARENGLKYARQRMWRYPGAWRRPPALGNGLLIDLGGLLKTNAFPVTVKDFEAFMVAEMRALAPIEPSMGQVIAKGGLNLKSYPRLWVNAREIAAENRADILKFYADWKKITETPATPKEMLARLKAMGLLDDYVQLQKAGVFNFESREAMIAALYSRYGKIKAGTIIWNLAKAALWRLPFAVIAWDFYHDPKTVKPENAGEFTALFLTLFPKQLFGPITTAIMVPEVLNIPNYFLSEGSKFSSTEQMSKWSEQLTNEILKYITETGLEASCFYLYQVSCDAYEQAKLPTEKVKTNSRVAILFNLITDDTLTDEDAFDPYTPGLINPHYPPDHAADRECYPCDPASEVYKAHLKDKEEIKNNRQLSSAEKKNLERFHLKNMLNSSLTNYSRECGLKLREDYLENHPQILSILSEEERKIIQQNSSTTSNSCRQKYPDLRN